MVWHSALECVQIGSLGGLLKSQLPHYASLLRLSISMSLRTLEILDSVGVVSAWVMKASDEGFLFFSLYIAITHA